MPQPHSDNSRIKTLIHEHDRADGNQPGPDGKLVGYDSFALFESALIRARTMFEGYGPLRKTMPPERHDEVIRLMAAMWQDGFVIGARSQQTDD